MKPRQRRLLNEFKLISSIRTENSLFDFLCGRLTQEDADSIQRENYRPRSTDESTGEFTEEFTKNIFYNYQNYFLPEDYSLRFPDYPPEKYLIVYSCDSMVYKEETLDKYDSDSPKKYTLTKRSVFLIEILYGLDFPVERPVFICTTKNIWHPNIRYPNICVEGRPFPAGVTLEYLIPMIGRMFQYQEYNLKSVLNSDAANWTRENVAFLPIDDRDILDKNRILRSKPVIFPLTSAWTSSPSTSKADTSPGHHAPVELLDQDTSQQTPAVELLEDLPVTPTTLSSQEPVLDVQPVDEHSNLPPSSDVQSVDEDSNLPPSSLPDT
jgi:hypothetical protein